MDGRQSRLLIVADSKEFVASLGASPKLGGVSFFSARLRAHDVSL
jgi:hypothetical protein